MSSFTLTTGNDTPLLTAGDDTIVADVTFALNFADVIDGLGGHDTLLVSAKQTVVLLATTLVNVETITITAGDFYLDVDDAGLGSGQTLTVDASASSGFVTWAGAEETDGKFAITGGSNSDVLDGGAGDDTLLGGSDADVVYGNTDGDLLYGNQASDTVFGGQNADTVFGGQDADLAYGNLGDDVLYGNLAADVLYGGQGNDLTYGGQGDDRLLGGLGDDTLNGGQGADSLSGGTGSDLFVVGDAGGGDLIADFDGAGGDRVQIAANANGTAIDTFDELLAAATNVSGNAVIDLGGGNTLTLSGVDTSQLQAGWFTFA